MGHLELVVTYSRATPTANSFHLYQSLSFVRPPCFIMAGSTIQRLVTLCDCVVCRAWNFKPAGSAVSYDRQKKGILWPQYQRPESVLSPHLSDPEAELSRLRRSQHVHERRAEFGEDLRL